MEKPVQLLHSEITYRGRVFHVQRDQVQLPAGRVVHIDVVAHPGAVTAVPVDDDGRIWFVRQYRHPAGAYMLELPAGTLEEGEPPQACMRREIREEIGMDASHLEEIGSFYLAPGYSTELMVVFLAKGLHPDPLEKDLDEILRVEPVPLGQVYAMVSAGEFRDAKTLAALLLAQPYLSGKLHRQG